MIVSGAYMRDALSRTDLSEKEKREVEERASKDFMIVMRMLRPKLEASFEPTDELGDLMVHVFCEAWYGGLIHGLRMAGAKVERHGPQRT